MTTTSNVETWIAEAATRGRDAGTSAASWITDGNTSQEHYAKLAQMMDAGDPALDDYLPAQPNLSGEWADAPTPRSLFEDITGLDAHAESSWNYDGYQEVLEAICEAWENACGEAFAHECERLVRQAIA